jgi:hypothetical protein
VPELTVLKITSYSSAASIHSIMMSAWRIGPHEAEDEESVISDVSSVGLSLEKKI